MSMCCNRVSTFDAGCHKYVRFEDGDSKCNVSMSPPTHLIWERSFGLPDHRGMPWTALQTEQVLGGTRSTRADAEVLADQSVISQYRRLTGKDTASTSSSAEGPAGSASKQRPIEGECAICYDSLKVTRTCSAHAILAVPACQNQRSSRPPSPYILWLCPLCLHCMSCYKSLVNLANQTAKYLHLSHSTHVCEIFWTSCAVVHSCMLTRLCNSGGCPGA